MNKKPAFEINGHNLYHDITILQDLNRNLELSTLISDDGHLYIAYLLEVCNSEPREVKSPYAGTGTFKVPPMPISTKYVVQEIKPEKLLSLLNSQITIRELFYNFNKTLYEIRTDLQTSLDHTNIITPNKNDIDPEDHPNKILLEIVNVELNTCIPHYILQNYYKYISEKFNVEE